MKFALLAVLTLLLCVFTPNIGDPHRPLFRYPDTVGNQASAAYTTRYANNRAELRRLAQAGGPRAELFGRWASDGRRILALDPRGDGRVVEVLGNLRTARNVAVLVPGNAKTLDNYDAGTAAAPRDGLRAQGAALLAQARASRLSSKTAVVIWLGYDDPENIDLVAARSDRARTGARSLRRLLGVLPGHARVSLVCHSYGTVVCGRATERTRVANLVALASPGMDADSARSLRTRVWAGRTADDPIRSVPHLRFAGLGHGTDPTADDFGARTIDTTGAHGHEDYFTPGGASLRAITAVVTGRADRA